MAQDIGVSYFYGVTGALSANKEDVMNAIVNIDPFDTPLLNMAPKVPVNHIFTEWLEHTLPTVTTAGRAEGQAFLADTITAPARKNNQTQIFGAHVIVSETQQSLSQYGFSDTFLYEVMRQTRGVMRNIESRIFAATGGAATGAGPVTATAAGTARVMKSIQDFLTAAGVANFNINAAAVGGAGNTGSASALTERAVNVMLQTAYTNGGNPNFLFASPAVKRQISAFNGNILGASTAAAGAFATINLNATDQQITRSVNSLLTDFGLVNVVLDKWVPQETISGTASTGAHNEGVLFALELPKIQIGYLRPIRFKRLAEDGDRVRGMVVGELTVKVLAAKAHGRLWNITNFV